MLKMSDENHPIHALIIGIVAYAATRNIAISLSAGGAAFAYMTAFGHRLPGTPATTDDPRIVLHGFQRRPSDR
jgi:hypothetical protein